MEMVIDFPGGKRVDAHFGPFTVMTDQPPQGGGMGSAPTPFATFLASIGTCAGIYVLGFWFFCLVLFCKALVGLVFVLCLLALVCSLRYRSYGI